MARQLEAITDPVQLTAELDHILDSVSLLLVELDGGLLRFSERVFPDADTGHVYAQKFQREAEGIGPHFDLYGSLVDSEYPYLGVYNLRGENDLKTVKLPDDLAKSYAENYPEANNEAYEARRHFGAIALGSPRLDVATGRFNPGMGLIFPQSERGAQIVHEVTPLDSSEPGEFVKLTVPLDEAATDKIEEIGYITLDELVTKSLGATIKEIKRSLGLESVIEHMGSGNNGGRERSAPLRSSLTSRPRRGSGLLD